jgi:hypothetical protein
MRQRAVGHTGPGAALYVSQPGALDFDPAREELGVDEIVRRWRECVVVTVDPGLRVSEERDASALAAIRPPGSLQGD